MADRGLIESRRLIWAAGLFIFLLALAVRLIFLYQHRANPTFELPIVDALTYHQLATDLAGGHGFGEKFFWQSFYYPLFLSGIYRIAGEAPMQVRLLQTLLGALTCVMGWWLGRRFCSDRAGLIAGLILVFYGPLIAQEGELLPTTWETFWLTLLLILLASGRTGWFRDFSTGFVAAMLVLTRAVFLPFVLLVGALDTWKRLRQRVFSGAVVSVVAFAMPLLLVAMLSGRETGHFSAVPGSGGFNFYLGNNPQSSITEAMRPGDDVMRVYRQAEQGGAPDRQASSAFFYAESLLYIREQPLHFVRGLLRKFANFFSSREIPRNFDVYVYRRWSSVLRVLIWKRGAFGFPFGVLGPLALLGLIVNRRRWPASLVACVIICPLTIIAYIAAGRYRVPLIPAFAVLAAGGLDYMFEAARLRNARRLTGSVALVFVLGTLICFPRVFRVERTDFVAELDYCIGGSLLERGRPDEAAKRFRAALERRPDYIEALYNYGVALARQGKIDEAVEQWQQVLRLEPGDTDAIRALEQAASGP